MLKRVLLGVSAIGSTVLGGQSILGPGDPVLVLSHLMNQQHEYRYLLRNVSDTTEQEYYRYHLEERLATVGGVSGLLIIKRALTTGNTFVDTLFLRQDGLAPVWERARINGTRIELQYQGRRVARVRTPSDSAPVRSDTTYQRSVFAFNEQELVLRSLPLAPGLNALLPLYSEGSDALEMDSVAVIGQLDPHKGAKGAWTVRFADPAIIETYVIDEATRRILSHETTSRPRAIRVVETLSE